jgi:hypothetical protein
MINGSIDIGSKILDRLRITVVGTLRTKTMRNESKIESAAARKETCKCHFSVTHAVASDKESHAVVDEHESDRGVCPEVRTERRTRK